MLRISTHSHGIARQIAPLVARAWASASYRNSLVGAEWSQADLKSEGISSDAKVRFILDNPRNLNFVLRHQDENESAIFDKNSDVWFEPSRCKPEIEFRYFSPIRLPDRFIAPLKALAVCGPISPVELSRSQFSDLSAECKCDLGAAETITIWKNSLSLRYVVLPCPPEGLDTKDYPRVAKAGDWLCYATFAGLLCETAALVF